MTSTGFWVGCRNPLTDLAGALKPMPKHGQYAWWKSTHLTTQARIRSYRKPVMPPALYQHSHPLLGGSLSA